MSNIGIALEMMFVGMITVFVILYLVVLIGNLIIRFANKYLPDDAKKTVRQITGTDQRKIAAIVSAVKTVTGGRGHVEKIEKF